MVVPLHIVGGGLAGSEAAWQAVRAGVPVVLHEMRPRVMTPAHRTGGLAELVCSNSLRGGDPERHAVGLLHEEMRALDSLILRAADQTRVPAGQALAVDREAFSAFITAALTAHPLVTLMAGEVRAPADDWGPTILATGPLTTSPLMDWLGEVTGEDNRFFFDALAPIVHADSLATDRIWRQSRWDRSAPAAFGPEEGDYLNCPLDRAGYDAFVDALLAADRSHGKDWEGTPWFEGCMPIEEMAERGRQTLRFGPMKPVGLVDPATGRRPWAVVQLRQENREATLYNMVGFQTRLRHGEQLRVFRMIPGLEEARFARLGGVHRNAYVRAPAVLGPDLTLVGRPGVRLAGQLTGCEGYVESAAVGLVAGRLAAAEARGETPALPPRETAIGALVHHLTTGADPRHFSPMNMNFGLLPPAAGPARDERRAAQVAGARAALARWSPPRASAAPSPA